MNTVVSALPDMYGVKCSKTASGCLKKVFGRKLLMEALLMIAEAENEANNGPTTLAYQCMKEVRERAGLNELPDMTQEEFRQTVKDERAMELCFEYTRRFDLIRWGEYVKNMRALVTEAQSGNNWTQGPTNVYTYFNISSTYNYFPIPDAEMSVNKDITQNNPGW